LDHSIVLVNKRAGRFKADEDSKLKDAVQTHGGKSWGAIAVLVPGRSEKRCRHRWHEVLDPIINQVSGDTGKWAEDEDEKLKDAVQTRGNENWVALSVLIPGRTRSQCWDRWRHVLGPNIDRESGRKGI
jgi:hypothetical protein